MKSNVWNKSFSQADACEREGVPRLRDTRRFNEFVFDDYEIETTPQGLKRKLHYLYGGDGLFAIMVRNGTTDTMYYIHKDYQGSFYCVSGADGKVVKTGNRPQVYSFDAWGRRRNYSTWTYSSVPTAFLFDRGYTGHEHLDKFVLINMNGRMYDPWLGRFLSPDPLVQDAANLQNYNRYSYCLNNPLKYTDPSGYSYHPDAWTPGAACLSEYSGFGSGVAGGLADWTRADNYFYVSNMTYNWNDGKYYDVYGNEVSQDFAVAITNAFFGQTSESNALTVLLNNMPQFSSAQIENGTMWLYYRGEPTDNQLNEQIQFQITAIDVAYGNVGSNGGNWINLANNVNTWVSAAMVGSERFLSWTRNGANFAYNIAYKGISKATNYIKPVGVGTSITGAIIGGYKFYSKDNKSWGVYGQLSVSLLSAGLTMSGPTAPIGAGIGVIDAFGGFSGFYNYLDAQQQFYNNTGGMFVPGYGFPY